MVGTSSTPTTVSLTFQEGRGADVNFEGRSYRGGQTLQVYPMFYITDRIHAPEKPPSLGFKFLEFLFLLVSSLISGTVAL